MHAWREAGRQRRFIAHCCDWYMDNDERKKESIGFTACKQRPYKIVAGSRWLSIVLGCDWPRSGGAVLRNEEVRAHLTNRAHRHWADRSHLIAPRVWMDMQWLRWAGLRCTKVWSAPSKQTPELRTIGRTIRRLRLCLRQPLIALGIRQKKATTTTASYHPACGFRSRLPRSCMIPRFWRRSGSDAALTTTSFAHFRIEAGAASRRLQFWVI
jgi:hypothetical protein